VDLGDTSKPEVIREVARVGAHIINDIRSLTEPGALEAAAETGLPVCLMHMQGQPKTMQEAPKYDDVFADVNRFFIEHIVRCERAGIAKEKLLLDPGFGFGKNLSHNYALLARLSEFHHFGLPLLVDVEKVDDWPVAECRAERTPERQPGLRGDCGDAGRTLFVSMTSKKR
jgi:dihydropteroate synthase